MWVIPNGRGDVIQLLMANGASIASPASHDYTALVFAAPRADEAAFQDILERRADRKLSVSPQKSASRRHPRYPDRSRHPMIKMIKCPYCRTLVHCEYVRSTSSRLHVWRCSLCRQEFESLSSPT